MNRTRIAVAIRLEPENALAWDQLSWNLGYQQPPDAVESEKAAREAIRLDPASPAAQYHLGRALVFQTRYDEAATAFQRAGEVESSDYKYLGMAQLSLARGQYDQAANYVRKYNPRNTAIGLYWLSAAYAAKGDTQQALATMQECLNAGFRDLAGIEASPYFSSLRSNPRFQQLLQRYRK